MIRSLTTLLLGASISINGYANDQQFEKCRSKLIQAQKLGVLQDLSWNGKSSPRVIVGPTFSRMRIDGKEGFAETVNCFLMAGDTKSFINFDVLDGFTGKPIGSYSYGRYKHK